MAEPARLGPAARAGDALASYLAHIMAWPLRWVAFWLRTRRRRVQLVTLLAVATASVLFTRVGRLEVRHEQAFIRPAKSAETAYIPPHLVLRLMALGHEPFLADVLFMRANQYFVDHLFADRIFVWLDTYTRAIVALDPDNVRVYEWASQAAKFGQKITREHLERSNEYARMGLERFPDNWRFYFDIGFNYFIETKPKSPEERAELRDKALEYFAVAAALPGSKLDPNLVAELYLQRNDVEMALFHAHLRYWDVSEREREELRARIMRYGSEAAARRLEQMEERWKADYAYLSPGLFELIGPERRVAVPRGWARASLRRESPTP